MNLYSGVVRKILFRFDPEKVHHFTFGLIKFIFKIPVVGALTRLAFRNKDQRLEKTVMGIKFPNPVGLAAGLDKNAILYKELSALGFGFIEVGTVTPLAQPGNDKPRLFRLPLDSSIINRMGFNNEGVGPMVERLKKNNGQVIIGGNIGKNKITPNEQALEDYKKCFIELFSFVDYFVVNVSSPNTPGLRELQEKAPLLNLLSNLQKLNDDLAKQKSVRKKPLLLKIAPDLTNEQLLEILEVVEESKIDGIIATNTTISREGLSTSPEIIANIGAGGLSGKALTKRSTEVIRFLAQHAKRKIVIIGAGGIHTAQDAIDKLNAGADLIQLYTGFIYEGPALIKSINSELLK
jgi:dihydroorotate dehydrogenase